MKEVLMNILTKDYDKLLEVNAGSSDFLNFIHKYANFKLGNESEFTFDVKNLNVSDEELAILKDINSAEGLGLNLENSTKDYDLMELANKLYLTLSGEKKIEKAKKTLPWTLFIVGILLLVGSVLLNNTTDEGARVSLTIVRCSLSVALIFGSLSHLIWGRIKYLMGILIVILFSFCLTFIFLYSNYDGSFFSNLLMHARNYFCSLFDYIIYDTYRSLGEYYG